MEFKYVLSNDQKRRHDRKACRPGKRKFGMGNFVHFAIDHLHNYGPGTRFGASPTRIGCDVCVSHLSVRSSSALECRSEITVVFLAVPIELGLVLRSSLVVFRGQVSSGSAGYLPFVRLTDRTTAPPTARSYALSKSFLRKSVTFMLVPKSLWTLPSPVLSNRRRLDTSRKQVQCQRCFLFARMSPKWAYREARKTHWEKAVMFAPAVFWAKWWGHSLSEPGRKQGEEVALQAKFVPGSFFFFF